MVVAGKDRFDGEKFVRRSKAAMFVVITRAQLKPGKIEDVRDLFERTNPALVKGQTDWVKAKFTADRTADQVTVLAFWRNADSYQKFRATDDFQQVMAQFGPFFASPPEISINEILFEMVS